MRNLRRYYELHEQEYVRRLGAGQSGWDAVPYDEFFMRSFVTRCLEQLTQCHRSGMRALDLGCGTGALSCQLTEAGFKVTGIDISPSAVAYAKQMAASRDLKIEFHVADVLDDLDPSIRYDLVVDGHLLHCVVFEKERFQLLSQIKQSLTAHGEFWVETMCLDESIRPNPDWNLDDRGVTWVEVNQAVDCIDAVFRDGSWWLPQRLIARSPDIVIGELQAAGFHVIESEWYPPLEPGFPGGVRARCGRERD